MDWFSEENIKNTRKKEGVTPLSLFSRQTILQCFYWLAVTSMKNLFCRIYHHRLDCQKVVEIITTGMPEHLRQATRRDQCVRYQKIWKREFSQLSNLSVAGVKLLDMQSCCFISILQQQMSTVSFSKNTIRIFNFNQNTSNDIVLISESTWNSFFHQYFCLSVAALLAVLKQHNTNISHSTFVLLPEVKHVALNIYIKCLNKSVRERCLDTLHLCIHPWR